MINIALFFSYFIILLIIAFSLRKVSEDDYSIAGRNVSVFGIVAALAASFRDGAGIAVWLTLALAFQLGSLWLVVGLIVGLLTLSFLGPPINNLARENNWVTPTDWIEQVFGKKTATISSLVILASATLYAAAQVFVAGSLVSAYTGINPGLSVASVALVTGLYISIGGYRAVTQTDKIQWLLIFMIFLLPMLLNTDIAIPAFETLKSPGLELGFGFAAISFLVVVSGGDVWQRIFSARSPEVARNGLLLTIPVYALISLGLVIFATTIGTLIPVESQSNLLFDIPNITGVNSVAVALFGLFAIASLMSTLDTQTYLISSTVSKYFTSINRNISSRISNAFISIGLLTILVLIALTIGDIVEFLFSAVTLATVLVPVFVLGCLRPNYKNIGNVVCASIAVGMVCYIMLFSMGLFSNILLTVVPAAITSLSIFILCLAKRLFFKNTEVN